MEEKLFGKAFFRNLIANSLSQLIVLTIAISASLYINSTLQEIRGVLDSVQATLHSIEIIATKFDPEKIKAGSIVLKQSAEVLGDGVGNAGEGVVNKIGNAFQNFKK
jgi:hypothetical protein